MFTMPMFEDKERNMIDCVSITEYVCNATLCGSDLLRVGSESYVPPGVNRHICLLLHQWESEGMMREMEKQRAPEWHRQRHRQTARMSVSLERNSFCCSSAPIFSWWQDAKTKMSPFQSQCTSLQHVQLKWFVCLSANIFTMQVFSHQCAGFLCCYTHTHARTVR